MRTVVVLFGPPGAGKTTIARAQTALTVYDRDDPHWASQGEARFRRAIAALATNPGALAIVIRAGATSTARRQAIHTTRATHAYLVLTDRRTCHHQAGHRRRHNTRADHAAIDTWFAKHERHDGIAYWPGTWAAALAQTPLQTSPRPAEQTWDW